MPEGLSTQGQRAHAIIVAYLTERGLLKNDGDQAFHAPGNWNQAYGTRSLLVIDHQGGPLGPVFSMDSAYESDCAHYRKTGKSREPYALYEGLQEKLREVGLYFEDCTRRYSAVYAIDSTSSAEEDA
jgi:hypothetical protein